MHSKWYPSPGHLADVLKGIWSVQAGLRSELSARVLPDSTSCLVFQRDNTVLRSCDNSWQPWSAASVSGPRTQAFDFKLAPAGHIFIVHLSTVGARRALGIPMSLLADRFETLDSVIGPGSVTHQLSDCVSESEAAICVRQIQQWLADRIRKVACENVVTSLVVEEVKRQGGNIRVAELARQIDLSRRQLGRIIRQQVGMSPKQLARIIRFDRSVQLTRARPSMPLVQIALNAGYSDQAHMAREFLAIGGIRPSDLRSHSAATIW